MSTSLPFLSSPEPASPQSSYAGMVAMKLRARPAEVIHHALATLARWRAAGQSNPHRLDQWETLLCGARGGTDQAGLAALLHALEDDDPASVRLRDFAPFAGVLTREERRVATGPCGYRH